MSDVTFDLTTLEGFTQGFREHKGGGVRAIHCPQCAASRRVFIAMVAPAAPQYLSVPTGVIVAPPHMFRLACLECRANAIAVVFDAPSGPDLAILWSVGGGLASPNTPEGVRYYLDQAARSESVGARSAAVAMYRAAIEQLLLDQGYTARMLGPKLKEVAADIAAGKAKPWARDLATDFMEVFKQLGNEAIHAGDPSKQETFDAHLVADLHTAMEALLDLVYERPARDADLLARLAAGASKLKK